MLPRPGKRKRSEAAMVVSGLGSRPKQGLEYFSFWKGDYIGDYEYGADGRTWKRQARFTPRGHDEVRADHLTQQLPEHFVDVDVFGRHTTTSDVSAGAASMHPRASRTPRQLQPDSHRAPGQPEARACVTHFARRGRQFGLSRRR